MTHKFVKVMSILYDAYELLNKINIKHPLIIIPFITTVPYYAVHLLYPIDYLLKETLHFFGAVSSLDT